jgi:hypothetical protein
MQRTSFFPFILASFFAPMRKINMLCSLILIAPFVAFVGCNEKNEIKENEASETNVVNNIQSVLMSTWSAASSDAHIYINHMGGLNGFDEYQISGYFYNGTSNQSCVNRVDVGDVTVGSLTLTKKDVAFNCISYGLDHPETVNDYSALFGGTVNISQTGGANYTANDIDFDITERLELSSSPMIGAVPNYPSIEVVSKNSGYAITWNSDPNNQFGDIVVFLKYSKNFTHEVDPSLTASSYTHHIVTEDDGSYLISPQDLSMFPVNSYIELYVGRGSYTQWDNNGKMIDVAAISRDNQDFVLTQ